MAKDHSKYKLSKFFNEENSRSGVNKFILPNFKENENSLTKTAKFRIFQREEDNIKDEN